MAELTKASASDSPDQVVQQLIREMQQLKETQEVNQRRNDDRHSEQVTKIAKLEKDNVESKQRQPGQRKVGDVSA